MPDIFRGEWTGKRTGNSYQMDITKADAAALGGSPAVEYLNADAIPQITEWGWEFRDKIPYGMPSALSGTLTFKPSRCPATLLEWLTDGITNLSSDIYTGGSTHTVNFETGTVFYLYVKPAGGTDFTLCAIGVQDVTQDAVPDPIKDTLEINIGDVLQHACKALTFTGDETSAGIVDADWDGITSLDASYAGVNAKNAVVDWVWATNATINGVARDIWFMIAHVPPGSEIASDTASCFWSVKIETMAACWSAYVQAIVRTITRRSTNVNLDDAFVKALNAVYKQDYQTTALTSSGLLDSELRWLMFVTNNNAIDPATSRDFSMHDVLSVGYDNVWDFLYDMPRSRFKTWWITHYVDGSIDTGLRQTDPFGSPFTIEDVTKQLRNPTIKMRGDAIVSRVEVQTEFAIGDDYDSEKKKAPSSRNNASIDVPVIFDPSPVMDTYTLGSALNTGYFTDRNQEVRDRLQNKDVVSLGTIDIQGFDGKPIGNPRMLGIYYVANPNDAGAGDAFHFDGAIIRCHSWQGFVIDGEAPVPPVSTPVVLSSTQFEVDGETTATVQQLIHGCIAQVGVKVYDAYYGRNATRIEADVEMDFGAFLNLAGTTSQWLPFAPVIRPFTVDPTTFNPYLSACPSTYYVVSCKYDGQTEMMKIELWGRA